MKKEPRLLHVSCIVRDDGEIWALLRAIEACAAGNVEVRPVGGDLPPHVASAMGFTAHAEPEQIAPSPPSQNAVIVPRLAGPKKKRATYKRKPDGQTKRMVLATLQHHVPMQIGEIVRATGLARTSVYVALSEMYKIGWVVRQKPGIYVRGVVPAGMVLS